MPSKNNDELLQLLRAADDELKNDTVFAHIEVRQMPAMYIQLYKRHCYLHYTQVCKKNTIPGSNIGRLKTKTAS